MSLADDLQAAATKAAVKCRACAWYQSLSQKDREAFDAFAANPDTSRTQLHRVCRENGLELASSAFLVHLRNHHSQ